MSGQEKAIIITCKSCGHNFVGAIAPPGTLLRIVAPCPSCGSTTETSYGVVTPFSDRLLYNHEKNETPPIQRNYLKKQIGHLTPDESSKTNAKLSEIFNAFIIWLDSSKVDFGTISVPAGHSINFLPLFQNPDLVKKILRKQLQKVLESNNIEDEVANFKSDNNEVNSAYNLLELMLDSMKEEGFNLAFLLALLLQLLTLK